MKEAVLTKAGTLMRPRLRRQARANPEPRQDGPGALVKNWSDGKVGPVGAALLTEAAWLEVARSLKLSEHEVEIAREVFDNLKEDAMAGDLGISEYTVHTHIHRLFVKLRVTTRTQMVLRIIAEWLTLILSEAVSLPSICRQRVRGRCPLEH
jgi:DNA-binding NarL/FixJ family response regulator